MIIKNKAPTTAGTVTGAANKTTQPHLHDKYSKPLTSHHVRLMTYLANAGNSLTTYEAAELGWQHLPTKLSEINQATGILFDKERLRNRFYRYTLSKEAREQWRAIRKWGDK